MGEIKLMEFEKNDELLVRRQKLEQLIKNGENPFEITKFDVTSNAEKIRTCFDELNETEVVVAGRILSKRVMGKICFAGLQDFSGKIQCYVKKDCMEEENFNSFKKLDVGDIIGVVGTVCKTERGEISVKTSKIILLS